MKTISPQSDYDGILPESDLPSKTYSESQESRPKLNQGQNNGFHSQVDDNETASLIICNSNLATSLQTSKSERLKISPGHYLQKVFLNSVTHKLKSQSLPSCVDKNKYQESYKQSECSKELLTSCDDSTDTNGENCVVENGDSKDVTNEAWFKTWPERGTDKCLNRQKIDQNYNLNGNTKCHSDEHSVENELKETVEDSVNNKIIRNGFGAIKTVTDEKILPNAQLGEQCVNCDSVVCNVNDSTCDCQSKQLSKPHTPVHINQVLENIPLGYSPVTKQLHIIKTKDGKQNSLWDSITKEQGLSYDITKGDKKLESDNDSVSVQLHESNKISDCDVSNNLTRVATEVSSFSSTVSSLSDISPSTNEDSALGSLLGLDHDSCSLASIGECSILSEELTGAKPKKKSLSGFFSRNVFGWKSSGSRNEDRLGLPNSSGWKLFGRSSPATVPCQNTKNNLTGSDTGSIATPDSPRSIKSSSGRVRSHENIVVSSSALIQLDRPSCLPAKSPDELEKHRQEYQDMVDAARKKEMKEAKLRKRQLHMQLRLEELQAQATRTWSQDILPKWETMCNSRKTRDLWWQGVPPCVRGKVWQLAIGNELNLTHQLFDICCLRAQDMLKTVNVGSSCDEIDSADNKEASVQLIQLDISRTFPNLCIFQQGGPYYDMLHCLLGAYVCYRPDVGYVQGMSFIAAVLILNMEAADAFICFANLLNRPCHMAFFSLNQSLMQAYYATYNDLLSENLPRIFEHFKDSCLTPDLYLLDWIYTVFTKAMNLDLACRVWDVFLRDGEEFIFRTALGVLHLCQDALLEMDFVRGSQYLTRLPDDLPADQLFKSIGSVRMSIGKQTFEDLLAFHSQAIN